LDVTQCLPDFEIVSFRVGKKSTVAGKTLAQIAMRKRYGVTLLAVRRNAELIYNPDPEIQFFENDLLVVIGQPEKISKVASLFSD
jgi:CPA2 family monovalent cation:H+ antiporter-2